MWVLGHALPTRWQFQQQKSRDVFWRWLNRILEQNIRCWGENRLCKMCLQVIYRMLSSAAMFCLFCMLNIWICMQKDWLGIISLKAKPGNGTFPWFMYYKSVLRLWLRLVVMPSEAMTWIEQKRYVRLPLFSENCSISNSAESQNKP